MKDKPSGHCCANCVTLPEIRGGPTQAISWREGEAAADELNLVAEQLSHTQLKIISLLAIGCTNQEIAQELSITVGTGKLAHAPDIQQTPSPQSDRGGGLGAAHGHCPLMDGWTAGRVANALQFARPETGRHCCPISGRASPESAP